MDVARLSAGEEARALLDCAAWVLSDAPQRIGSIFGCPDDLKFCFCMTSFAQVRPREPLFSRALDQFFGGEFDVATMGYFRRMEQIG